MFEVQDYRESAWFNYPQDEEVEFKMRRMDVDEVDRLRRQARAARALHENDLVLARWIDIIAEHFVIDWRGVTKDGAQMPYSAKNCAALLKRHSSLLEWVGSVATDAENFLANETQPGVSVS